MSNLLNEIRTRRNANVEQALVMLDLATTADTDTKYILFSTASPSLQDPAVLSKWLDAIQLETDTALKAHLIQRLTIRTIPDKQRLLSILAGSLQQDEARDSILPLLGRLSVTDREARKILIDFFNHQSNADTSRLILYWLLQPIDAGEDDILFYSSLLDDRKVDAREKFILVNRLLLQNRLSAEKIAALLTPEEPAPIKEMVLDCCFDRSLVPEKALTTLVEKDKDPRIRTRAIQLLSIHGLGTPQIIDAIRNDPDATTRQAALRIFEYGIQLTPEIIGQLCETLLTEKKTATAVDILWLLAPYTEKNSTLVNQLLQLLNRSIQRPVAVQIYSILGRLVPNQLPLFEYFVQAYEKEQHDECRTVILQAISSAVSFGNEIPDFYNAALLAPSPAIKEQGMRGLLLVPLTRENAALIEDSAPVLLHTGLDRDLRYRLAKKISCLPQLTTATVKLFTQLADHEHHEPLKAVCVRVQEKAISNTGAENINWEQWLHKADVEHDLSGIFPHIWLYYKDYPEMANRVLWSAMNPANSNALYQEGVSDMEILNFLAVNAGVDDKMSRYVLNRLLFADLGYESKFNSYLLILKINPGLEDLKGALWLVLEKRGRYVSPVLLHELLSIIWGQQLETEFRTHLLQQQTVAGITPYISYLAANATWTPVPDLLRAAVQLPCTQEQEFKQVLREAFRNSGLQPSATQPSPQDDGPGFAD